MPVWNEFNNHMMLYVLIFVYLTSTKPWPSMLNFIKTLQHTGISKINRWNNAPNIIYRHTYPKHRCSYSDILILNKFVQTSLTFATVQQDTFQLIPNLFQLSYKLWCIHCWPQVKSILYFGSKLELLAQDRSFFHILWNAKHFPTPLENNCLLILFIFLYADFGISIDPCSPPNWGIVRWIHFGQMRFVARPRWAYSGPEACWYANYFISLRFHHSSPESVDPV